MAERRFLLSGFVLLTWMLIMLYPYSSQADQNDLSRELDTLLNILNIPHSNDLDNMVEATQAWRRAPDQERWQLKDLNIDQKTYDKALLQLQQLDLINEIKPQQTAYDYALLLGATVPRMQKRLDHLISLWKTGTRFNKIIFLVGIRPLVPEIDTIQQLTARTVGNNPHKDAFPATELEGAEMIIHSTSMPDAMRQLPVEYVSTPRRWEDNRWQRANTRETTTTWSKTKPKPGSALVMSEQPSAHYQVEVVRQELPESFSIDLAARPALPETRLVILLDALALWLHNARNKPEHLSIPAPQSSEVGISPTRH